MSTKKITLKTAKKKPGSLSRAKVRSVVAAVYNTSSAEFRAPKAGASPKVLLTRG